MDEDFDMIGFGMETLVGFLKKSYPMKDGNCFSAITKKIVGKGNKEEVLNTLGKHSIRIVNFYSENLRELIRRGIVSFPIQCKKLNNEVGIILDKRIPKEWYRNEYCPVCCPTHLIADLCKK